MQLIMKNANLVYAGKSMNTGITLMTIGSVCCSIPMVVKCDPTLTQSLIAVYILFGIAGVIQFILCGQALIKAGKEV
jgi:hypothetical protein